MDRIKKSILVLIASLWLPMCMHAQVVVVIMNQDYTCEDPRGFDETSKWVLKKGDALLMYKRRNSYEYYGYYTAASVEIPSRFVRLPGTISGEKYIVINVDDLNLREGPSTTSGIWCYDSDYGGSIAQEQFLKNPRKVLGAYGSKYSWKPYHLPKGTRLPYLGTVNGFYKTKFNGVLFYLSTKYCTLK